MHVGAGLTRVSLLRGKGLGLAGDDLAIDIPTSAIPPHLRDIGPQFIVVMPKFAPEAFASAESIREMSSQIRVEEITDDNKV